LEPGQLKIKGCTIKFSACKSREFAVLVERSRREKEFWYDKRGGEIKVKQIGNGFPKRHQLIEEAVQGTEGFWLEKTVDATVLPPQPVVVLDNSSLQDACLMLLEGET
jgi:hypothetical protein